MRELVRGGLHVACGVADGDRYGAIAERNTRGNSVDGFVDPAALGDVA